MAVEESPFVKWTLITIALAFCAVFLLIPLANVFAQALSKGIPLYLKALQHPDSKVGAQFDFARRRDCGSARHHFRPRRCLVHRQV